MNHQVIKGQKISLSYRRKDDDMKIEANEIPKETSSQMSMVSTSSKAKSKIGADKKNEKRT